MAKARISAVFNRRKKLNKHNQAEVEVYVYLNQRKKYYSTGIYLLTAHWSKKKNQVNDLNDNYIFLNHHIQDIVNKAEAYQLKILQQRDISFDDFDFHFGKKGDKQQDFIQFCEEYTGKDNSVKAGTTKNRQQYIRHLKNCFPNGLSFALVNHDSIEKFDNYLRSLGHCTGTVNKHHNRAKKFIQEAINRDLIVKSPYTTFKVKRPSNQIKNVLWYPDIKAIELLSYQGTMEVSRLKFLFSCYTGLRVSDTNVITWDQVRNDRIIFDTIKTGRQAVVPISLFPNTQMLIDRLKRFGTNTLFPSLSDVVYNRNLKTIAIDAGIPFPLTSHVARHTFCTLIAHQTQSPFKVMEYTGISKIDTAMIYINLQKLFS